MVCLVLVILFTTVVVSVHTCSPCSCFTLSEGKWKNLLQAKCNPTLSLSRIPDTLHSNIQVLLFDGQQLVSLEENISFFHSLQVLSIRNNFISTINDYVFKNMTSLIDISLSDNKLKTLPTRLFEETPNLELLWLHNNNIIILQKDLFSNLDKLKEIHLYDNQITTIEEDCFINDIALQEINLDNNKLKILKQNVFSNLASLKQIFISNNEISIIEENCFMEDFSLEYIGLSHNKLKFLSKNRFSNLKSLEEIDISYNEIKEIDEECFADNFALKEIRLHNNNIIKLPSNLFTKTINVEIIWLNNNKIVVLQKNLFSNLKNLKEIHLYNNRLTTIEENCFANVPLLQEISLQGNNLTNLQLNMMHDTTSLKQLQLHDNPWRCDEALCELMDAALSRAWLRDRQVPECASPDKTKEKLWTDLLQDFAPTIQPNTRIIEVEKGANISLRCNHCFASKAMLVYKGRPGRGEKSSEHIENFDVEEYYSCRIIDCPLCEEEYVFLRTRIHVSDVSAFQKLYILILVIIIITALFFDSLFHKHNLIGSKTNKIKSCQENDECKVIDIQTCTTIVEGSTTNMGQEDTILNCASSQTEEENYEGICSVLFGFILTLVLCILYLADVYSDISLAVLFYVKGEKFVGCLILLAVYGSSLLTVIFERRTRSRKGKNYYIIALVIFMLNVSGVLLFKDILIIRWKKLKLTLKKSPIKQSDNTLLNEKIQDLAFLKVIEAFTENLPIIIIQMYYRVLLAHVTHFWFNWISATSFLLSYIAFITTLIGFVNNVSSDQTVLSNWYKVVKYTWLFFVTFAKINATAFTLFEICIEFTVLISFHYFLFGRFIYKNKRNQEIKNGDESKMKTDNITSSVFGFVFIFVPYLYSGKNNFYKTSAVTHAHVIFLIYFLTLSYFIIYVKLTIPYHIFVTCFFIIGVFFYFILVKKY